MAASILSHLREIFRGEGTVLGKDSVSCEDQSENLSSIETVYKTSHTSIIGGSYSISLQAKVLKPGEKFSSYNHLFWRVTSGDKSYDFAFDDVRSEDKDELRKMLFTISKTAEALHAFGLRGRLNNCFESDIKLTYHAPKLFSDSSPTIGLSWREKRGRLGERITEEDWNVCIICPPSAEHAEVVCEGLIYGELVGRTHFMWIAHLVAIEEVGGPKVKVQVSDIRPSELRIGRRSEVWATSRSKVNSMLESIRKEKGVSYSIVPIFNRENCLSWAKKHVERSLGVKVPKTSRGLSFRPNSYTTRVRTS